MELSRPAAKLDLALLDAEVKDVDRTNALTVFTNAGIPPEVTFRLTGLWETTRIVGGKTVQIGKIIILQIIKFIRENPHLTIGIALGAAIGALTSLIPFIGPLLTPLVTVIGLVIGGVGGRRMDRGEEIGTGIIGLTQEIIDIAKKFFELFAAIFNALRADFQAN